MKIVKKYLTTVCIKFLQLWNFLLVVGLLRGYKSALNKIFHSSSGILTDKAEEATYRLLKWSFEIDKFLKNQTSLIHPEKNEVEWNF